MAGWGFPILSALTGGAGGPKLTVAGSPVVARVSGANQATAIAATGLSPGAPVSLWSNTTPSQAGAFREGALGAADPAGSVSSQTPVGSSHPDFWVAVHDDSTGAFSNWVQIVTGA